MHAANLKYDPALNVYSLNGNIKYSTAYTPLEMVEVVKGAGVFHPLECGKRSGE